MSMTPDELDACRVFLAAYRTAGGCGARARIEVWLYGPPRPPRVQIVRTEQITISANIPVVAETS